MSYLAATERLELPVGETLHLHGHVIEALSDGFRVDGEVSGPRTIEAGRYRLRLSHQNMPAVVVLDADAPRAEVAPDWFAYDEAYRFDVPLERLGFAVGGVPCRVMALRLNEPGASTDALEVYFTDATSGRESYRMRYLDVAAGADGRYVLDFNRAYNPACAYSPHYNCPIPPPENHLAVAIRAGERTPRGK